MAGDFEDHVWKDVVPENILDIYQVCEHETYVDDIVEHLHGTAGLKQAV